MGRAFRVIRVVAVLEHFGVASDCLIYMGTLSKAYGAIAGFVAATPGKRPRLRRS
jgi:7-keto-8-aminopelargonate synthetase-like enzyme